MQRLIKFRAWDAKNKKIVTSGLSINIDTTGRVIPVSFAQGDIAYCRDNDVHSIPDIHRDITLMQYTGLKSKSGVEIYEGDIIQYETNYYGNRQVRKAEVKWHDDLEHDGFGEPLAMGYIFRGANIEVIGNIHENPELLNQEPERAEGAV